MSSRFSPYRKDQPSGQCYATYPLEKRIGATHPLSTNWVFLNWIYPIHVVQPQHNLPMTLPADWKPPIHVVQPQHNLPMTLPADWKPPIHVVQPQHNLPVTLPADWEHLDLVKRQEIIRNM